MHALIQHVAFAVCTNPEALGGNQVNRGHHIGTPHFPREEGAITKAEYHQGLMNQTLGAKGPERVMYLIATAAPPGVPIGGDHSNSR